MAERRRRRMLPVASREAREQARSLLPRADRRRRRPRPALDAVARERAPVWLALTALGRCLKALPWLLLMAGVTILLLIMLRPALTGIVRIDVLGYMFSLLAIWPIALILVALVQAATRLMLPDPQAHDRAWAREHPEAIQAWLRLLPATLPLTIGGAMLAAGTMLGRQTLATPVRYLLLTAAVSVAAGGLALAIARLVRTRGDGAPTEPSMPAAVGEGMIWFGLVFGVLALVPYNGAGWWTPMMVLAVLALLGAIIIRVRYAAIGAFSVQAPLARAVIGDPD